MRSDCPRARSFAWLAALGLGLLATACAAPTPRPALVAKSQEARYGYSEIKLSETRYDVVYETPALDISADRDDREDDLEGERRRAYDFAVWRAAEKARELGYAALMVEQDRRDADVSVQRVRSYDPWPGYYHPYYGRYYGYPYYYGRGYGPGPHGYRDWASARITVTLRVRFLSEMEAGALGVEETLADLVARYGSPTYP